MWIWGGYSPTVLQNLKKQTNKKTEQNDNKNKKSSNLWALHTSDYLVAGNAKIVQGWQNLTECYK